MKSLTVASHHGDYRVAAHPGAVSGLGPFLDSEGIAWPRSVVSNITVGPLWAGTAARSLDTPLIELADGEENKRWPTVEDLLGRWLDVGLHRGDTVVAVGGGVLTDTVGFAAAVYLRGISWIAVPTTLLAMVDSALGGKTGVDLPEGKNYVGAVYQPEAVVMDPVILGTLPARELSCGFAEVVKYGLLVGGDLMEMVAAWPELPGPDDALADLIRRCAECKLEVVAEDEMDLGRRAILNLGHTAGHGIEAAGGYDLYHHGEAISLGLLAALRVSERELGLDPTWRRRTADTLGRHGLPVTLDPSVDVDQVIEIMGRDKKSDGRALNMVLLRAPGDVLTHQDPDPAVVRAAVEELVP